MRPDHLKGLNSTQAQTQLNKFGFNQIMTSERTSVVTIFFRQFKNPLIYILMVAGLIAILLDDYSDAIFITIVILLNAIIGLIQENSAEKSAASLKELTPPISRVKRDGCVTQIAAQKIVPDDVVLLESGEKVPADGIVLEAYNLECDEALLTGESLSVSKLNWTNTSLSPDQIPKQNRVYAGTIVTKGRCQYLVTETGGRTELGKIAESLEQDNPAKPPLVQRFELFTKKIGLFFVMVAVLMATYLILIKGQSWNEVLMLTVALAVSAIPEGLPVAMTVALTVAANKMQKRNVIVRRLPAVEALGSCTFIATDKTGTLTVNQLTIKKVMLPNGLDIDIPGSGYELPAEAKFDAETLYPLKALSEAGYLCNEATLNQNEKEISGIGDAVDIAFLILNRKINPSLVANKTSSELIDQIPFEAENQFAVTLHRLQDQSYQLSIKGSFEKISKFCKLPDLDRLNQKIEHTASEGFRIISLASKKLTKIPESLLAELSDLDFLGSVAMIDPLRPEAKKAIQSSKKAGINIAMVTGDHPKTALAIAKELDLAHNMDDVVTGYQLKQNDNPLDLKNLIRSARVFARVEPRQKLLIVETLIKDGHFVAVTGDGANDAPALKAANVGIAMGKSGTDIAKDSSDLIITDDRFASIQAGIEEGRIAYSNIRKVVYLLISTGLAEVILFVLALLFDTPMPLTAVQILWLNLVTNGIQDKGLAFEPREGDELLRKPRDPSEPIFNRPMINRILLSSFIMGGIGFIYFKFLLATGMELGSIRNLVLLLMVLFENMMVLNCKSETKSILKTNLLNNTPLTIAVILAQGLHILAMYIPGLNTMLGVSPVSLQNWLTLLLVSSSIVIVMELYKRASLIFKLNEE